MEGLVVGGLLGELGAGDWEGDFDAGSVARLGAVENDGDGCGRSRGCGAVGEEGACVVCGCVAVDGDAVEGGGG